MDVITAWIIDDLECVIQVIDVSRTLLLEKGNYKKKTEMERYSIRNASVIDKLVFREDEESLLPMK